MRKFQKKVCYGRTNRQTNRWTDSNLEDTVVRSESNMLSKNLENMLLIIKLQMEIKRKYIIESKPIN